MDDSFIDIDLHFMLKFLDKFTNIFEMVFYNNNNNIIITTPLSKKKWIDATGTVHRMPTISRSYYLLAVARGSARVDVDFRVFFYIACSNEPIVIS